MNRNAKKTQDQRQRRRPTVAEKCATVAKPAFDPRPVDALLHQLQVHQIELEMQNEALRETQIALETSRDRFVDFYEFSPVGYLTISEDGLISDINLTGADLLGAARGQLLQTSLARFVAPEDADRWNLHLVAALERPEKSACELLLQRADGIRFHGRLDSLRLVKTGQPDTLRLVLTDIGERKRAEAVQRESQEQYRRLAEDMPLFIASFLPDGTLTYVNDALTALVGISREELTGRNFYDFLSAEDRAMVRERLALLAPERPLETHEQRYQRPGESVGWQQWTNRAFFDTAGRIVRLQAVGEDISERKRAEAALAAAKHTAEKTNRAKSRFLAAASHDLRQPIQAINLFNDALAKTELSAAQKNISDHLALSVTSLGNLLNALLDISKLDAHMVKPHDEEILVRELFRQIDLTFSPMALERGLRFMLSFPFRELALVTDAKLLASLLGNLIGNAIKYTERGGILVGLRQRGKRALIQVWDSGIGIPAENLEDIFEEYFQIGNPERDQANGLGLGLSIVSRLAELLETRVTCRSRLGKGTVFELSLPLAERYAGHDTSTSQAAGAPCGLYGFDVVVIEDNPMVAEAMRLTLESLGMKVTTFDTAESALEYSALGDADCFISDFRLPGMNGLQLLEAIEQELGRPIKALLLTGESSPEMTAQVRCSRWPLLLKPIELSRLLAAMEAQSGIPG